MFTLILGQSKAGKSRYAEKLAADAAKGPLVYIATLIPVGEGETGAALVARHRAQREGYGFETIERPKELAKLELPAGATVLLEDVSNLLANYLFAEGAPGGREEAMADVLALRDSCEELVAVSFFGLTESDEYDRPTNHYIAELALLNRQLWAAADRVVMLEKGVPTQLKPEGGEA